MVEALIVAGSAVWIATVAGTYKLATDRAKRNGFATNGYITKELCDAYRQMEQERWKYISENLDAIRSWIERER